MNIALGILWLTVSIFFLVKSSDYFTDYSEQLGKKMGISQFIIGITIIALGTSLPELASSAIAVYKGSSEILAANVIGSNVANILLVIGLAAIFAKVTLKPTIQVNSSSAGLLIGATILIAVSSLDGKISIIESIFLLLGYLSYMYYSVHHKTEKEETTTKEKIGYKTPIIILLSAVFIYISAEQTINSLIYLSTLIGISTSVISLAAVALGTSLPEAFVSVSAARKGNYDIALGNVIGSNMFNILLIPGTIGLFSTLVVSPETMSTGIIFLIASLLLFLFSMSDNKIQKSEGIIFVLLYIFFIYNLFL